MEPKLIVAAVAFAASASASALECNHIEFAELESMTKEELLAERCETFKIYQFEAVGGGRETIKCLHEIERRDRMIAKKYELSGDAQSIATQIDAKCRAITKMVPGLSPYVYPPYGTKGTK